MRESDALEVDITLLRTCQLNVEIVRNLLVRLRSEAGRTHQRALLLPTSTLHRDLEQTLELLRAELNRREEEEGGR